MLFSKPKYQLKPGDRQFLDYVPPVSILLGGLIFLGGVFYAMITYQTPKYDSYQFFDQFLSELGVRFDYMTDDGVMRYAPENPEIFNYTLYICGVLMIPFFMFSYRQMRNHNRVSNFFLVIATITGVLAGPFMIGVGIFDLSGEANEIEIWQEHGFWASGLYLLIMITAICWFLMLILSADLPYHKSKWIWMDYVLIFVLVLIIIINILDGLKIVLAENIPYVNTYPIQAYQKMIAILFFIYYGLIVGVRLSKTKYDNTPVVAEQEPGGSETAVSSSKDAVSNEKSSERYLYCVDCGTKNPMGAPHCTSCGGNLSSKQSS